MLDTPSLLSMYQIHNIYDQFYKKKLFFSSFVVLLYPRIIKWRIEPSKESISAIDLIELLLLEVNLKTRSGGKIIIKN